MFTPAHWVHTGIHSHLITAVTVTAVAFELPPEGWRWLGRDALLSSADGTASTAGDNRGEGWMDTLCPVSSSSLLGGAGTAGWLGNCSSHYWEDWAPLQPQSRITFQSCHHVGSCLPDVEGYTQCKDECCFLPSELRYFNVPNSAKEGRPCPAGKHALPSFIVSSFTVATLHSATGQQFQVRDNKAILWLPHSHCWLFSLLLWQTQLPAKTTITSIVTAKEKGASNGLLIGWASQAVEVLLAGGFGSRKEQTLHAAADINCGLHAGCLEWASLMFSLV